MNHTPSCLKCESPCFNLAAYTRDDPPFLGNLLVVNDPPLDTMLGPLKSSAHHVTAALDETLTEIRRISDVLNILESKRRQLEEIDSEYKTALAPIRRVPPEIIMEVFYAFTNEHEFYDVFDVNHGPWVLSRVCRRWRHVSISLCPSIWASMLIKVTDNDPTPLLMTALSYSANCKLDFSIIDISINMPANIEPFDELVSQSKRWRSAHFNGLPWLMERLLPIRGNVPNLEVCHINLRFFGIPATYALDPAPRLKHLHLKDLSYWQAMIVTAHNLVSLSDDRMNDPDGLLHSMYLGILRGSPYLETFDIAHFGVALPVAAPRIVHLTLQKLVVWETAFISSLELPALKSLEIYRRAYPPVYITPPGMILALHNLIEVSRCSLTHLFFSSTVLDNHVLSILELCPGLISLQFQMTDWTADSDLVFQNLATRMTEKDESQRYPSPVMIPWLQKYEIVVLLSANGTKSMDFVDSAFVKMVETRLVECQVSLTDIIIRSLVDGLSLARFTDEDIEKLEGYSYYSDINIQAMTDGELVQPVRCTVVCNDTLYVLAFDSQQSVYWIYYGGLPPFTLLTRIDRCCAHLHCI
ncbi:hypothetical protein ARMSODRAFT_959574 [Armillaria solidipes]|uniref:F-box domain-containing protein n=1 Tax=Armillaria solidipes TaxID=1076256 RepID=A0A2H3BQP4_9AGAR|nr:hypothetical protein ARMSODRAFT_959574 [Armillaria solidipes]